MSSRGRWTAITLAVIAASGGLAGAVASYAGFRLARQAHRPTKRGRARSK